MGHVPSASDSNDAAIILRLTRENAELRRANTVYEADLAAVAAHCDRAQIVTEDQSMFNSGPYGPTIRVALMGAELTAARVELAAMKETKWEGYSVWHVITPTSIDDVEDLVVAKSEAAVMAWFAADPKRTTNGFHLKPGPYQVQITRIRGPFWTEVFVLWEGQGDAKPNWPVPPLAEDATVISPPSTPPDTPVKS